jgi:nitrous-oxide reductase
MPIFRKADPLRVPLAITCVLIIASSCFSEKNKPKQSQDKSVASDIDPTNLNGIVQTRGLTEQDLIAAAKTFVPTGGQDEYVGIMGLGSSGRIAAFSMPSMRLLKFTSVFTPEPWQGFAYDDQSKAIIEASGRGDIEYLYGDVGLPAYSQMQGRADGHTVFVADGAHGRVALVTLDDYETKQIVVNPVFRTSHSDIAVTPDTEFVVQTTQGPEVPGAVTQASQPTAEAFRGGMSFWHITRESGTDGHIHDILSTKGAFTVELPPYIQSRTVIGKNETKGMALTIGACRDEAWSKINANCGSPQMPSVLHVVHWQTLASLAASSKKKFNEHPFISISEAAAAGGLYQIELPAGAEKVAVTSDGRQAVVTSRLDKAVRVLDLMKVIGADRSAAKMDDFGVPTLPLAAVESKAIDVGGPSVEAAIGKGNAVYVTVHSPGRLVKIDLNRGAVVSTLELGFNGSHVMIPDARDGESDDRYAVVLNRNPSGRFVSSGPLQVMNPQLIDISGERLQALYDMTVPQANNLAAIALPADRVKTVVRYKAGTDSRTGKASPFKTMAGQERIERNGNRVHVFATLIRSHITPEIIEVEEGDIVSIHLTNLEQAQDQTHGFTVSTYNVHGSWEPGKTASVTFTADRTGAFPVYCTEFCSALHLEMQGYLMVKPKGWKPSKDDVKTEEAADTSADKGIYEAKMQQIKDTQAVIDGVVKWLNDNNYKQNANAAAFVEDAVMQLEQIKGISPKIDKAVQAGDWSSARLWAEQYFQYQVKAADAGLRAKKLITELGGSK